MWRITRDCLCSARIKYPRNCNSKPKQDCFREGRAIVRSRYDSSFRKSFIIFHFRIFSITVNGKSGQIIPSKIWLFHSLLHLKNKMNPAKWIRILNLFLKGFFKITRDEEDKLDSLLFSRGSELLQLLKF